MKKKFKKLVCIVAVFQILLLVNLVTAHSYLISQSNSEQVEKESFVIKVVHLLGKLLSIKQIGLVSAETINETYNITNEWEAQYSLADVSWSCCSETKSGAICQDLGSMFLDNCAVDTIPTKCENFMDCKQGCCVDEEEGLCTTKATKLKCENDGGVWKDEENCLIEECQKGCCVLGGNVLFVTETRCERLAVLLGSEKDFRDYETELSCLALSASQFEGACVLYDDSCSFTTEENCVSRGGVFSKDYLCSNPVFNNSCERQASIGCVEGKDEIYWFDSCDNRENIYSSDKDASWNSGMVLAKTESCGAGESNAGSENCGNCNAYLGSRCYESSEADGLKVEDGDYVCSDLNCYYTDEWGKDVVRKNGESWCVYDGYIGSGKDTVGSRHWKRSCVEGEVVVEPCADYRGQICVQSEISSNDSDETFSTASCVINEAMMCIDQSGCGESNQCFNKHIQVGSDFQFDMCVPEYPRGFDLSKEGGKSSAQICGMANIECKVVYVKDFWGDWHCEHNCECEKATFAEQMNDLCVSLGDCGSYVNYQGAGTDNIMVSNSPSISSGRYAGYAEPVEGQYAEADDLEKILKMIGGSGSIKEYEEPDDSAQKSLTTFGTVTGALGSVVGALVSLEIIGTVTTTTKGAGAIPSMAAETSTSLTPLGATLSAFAIIATTTALGLMAGGWLANTFERTGEASLVLMIAGGVLGAGIGSLIVGYGTTLFAEKTLEIFVTGGWITAGIAAAVILYILLIGWGETKTRTVEFKCYAWQPPAGGEHCDECDDDLLKPCSKYRCESLGRSCMLLNEDEENPICESIAYETNPPVISVSSINDGYGFFKIENKGVEIRTAGNDCIPEWTTVLFELQTDEFAQCRYSFERTDKYEDMTNYPAEQTLYGVNHTFGFAMPSLSNLAVYNLTGDIKEMFGNMNMYVRCQDVHGNYNLDEYRVNFCIKTGPDITPARVVHASPKNQAYVEYGVTEKDVVFHLNEPAECKYDIEEDKTYDTMANSMDCVTGVFDNDEFGWECNTTLTDIKKGINIFYIKCKDQPWFAGTINKTDRNVNSEGYVYTLHGSESILEISSVSPSGEVEAGFEPVSVDLKVETIGGAENGKATCYYDFSDYENMNLFYDTYLTEHKQNFNMMMRGDYEIFVKCEDSAGNTDEDKAEFSLVVDSSAPEVVRIYHSSDELVVITDEPAECYYDFNRCNFDLTNGTSMTTALSTTHSADWITGKTYHIKCKDVWGNSNPTCAIKIKSS